MAIASNFPAIRPSLDLNFAAGNFDPRITFSRASAATYYDGKTAAKAEENLLTYSQEFASWGVPGTGQCSVTSDVAVAPDGTMTADLLFPDTSTAGYRARSSANTVTTSAGSILSFYVKPAGYNFVSIVLTNSFGRATIDVTSGAITNYGTNAFSVVSTTLVGDWYRVVLSVSASITAASLWLGPNSAQRDPLAAWAGDGTSGVYLWGAQLEQRSQVTAYTPTTTQTITNYIPVLQTAPANVPRIDHDPVTGECKGLLIEEPRTNLLTYSEQFDNVVWAKTRATVMANTAVAPDGAISADKLVEDTTATSSHLVVYSTGTLAAGSYTTSVYVKAAGRQKLRLSQTLVSSSYADFDLASGTSANATNCTASISAAGNGWYRCCVTFSIASSQAVSAVVYLVDAGGITTYTGDGYSGVYIWGTQLEAGSSPTSYIPTTTAQVTRAADSASMTGANFSSWYRVDGGTVFGEFSAGLYTQSIADVGKVFCARDSAQGNYGAFINFAVQANGCVRSGVSYNGSDQSVLTTPNTIGSANTYGKAAFSFGRNSFASTLNGRSTVSSASGNFPTTVNEVRFGSHSDGTNLNGHIKRISYYPKRLTDAQLQALTA